jgi:hypothetical protein
MIIIAYFLLGEWIWSNLVLSCSNFLGATITRKNEIGCCQQISIDRVIFHIYTSHVNVILNSPPVLEFTAWSYLSYPNLDKLTNFPFWFIFIPFSLSLSWIHLKPRHPHNNPPTTISTICYPITSPFSLQNHISQTFLICFVFFSNPSPIFKPTPTAPMMMIISPHLE